MSCDFCENQEVKERTVVENDQAFAFPTYIPIVPGHMLIAPKRHATTADDLSMFEVQSVFQLRGLVMQALTKEFDAEGFHFAWNEGEVAGQTVPHFHLHVIPRKKGDEGITEYEPRKFLYRPGSREETQQSELLAVRDQLRAVLKGS